MKKITNFIICFVALILGVFGGGVYVTYITLPETEELVETENQFYSFNANGEVNTAKFDNGDDVFSVHFLELGNKYTGDATYIKYGNTDILIDCGSRSNSVQAVSSYLNKYVTDNTLEYVIITHAHRDHYAGFAASNSIFDLYICKNIIDFGNATNQEDGAATYERYKKERNAEIDAGATYIPAISCRNQDNTNREFIIDATNDIKFEVLYNEHSNYDKTNPSSTAAYKAASENDYSVCTLFSYGEQKFLFTGDLESGEEHNKVGGEEKLVANNVSLQELRDNNKTHGVSLYKAGHHGSKTSSGSVLLAAIRPEYVGICCCAGSDEYKAAPENTFPTQAFIDRISEYTDKIFVTTLCVDWKKGEFTSFNGNIVVWIKPQMEGVSIDCSNNNKKLKETEWFANNRTNPWVTE